MSNSWGHAVRRLTAEDIACAERMDREDREPYYTVCRMPKCRARATHETRYSYVTGRAGRTSWAAKNVCTGHAEKFAAKHGIEITDAGPQEHATQQAVRAAFGIEPSSPLAAKEG